MTPEESNGYLNILNDDDILRPAFDEMEHDGFYDISRGNEEYLHVGYAKTRTREILEGPQDEQGKRESLSFICIYGAGGWHRYFIGDGGVIIFDTHYAGADKEKKACKAIDLGFDIR